MALAVWLLIALCLNHSRGAVVRTTTAPGCHSNGQFYPEGSSYSPSDCKHCYCSMGREMCAIADCFFTPCVDSVHKPGVCCPVCPNGSNCWAGKQKIPAGKDVKIDESTRLVDVLRLGMGLGLMATRLTVQ